MASTYRYNDWYDRKVMFLFRSWSHDILDEHIFSVAADLDNMLYSYFETHTGFSLELFTVSKTNIHYMKCK